MGRVVVVGGGITGLAAALELAKTADHEVTVLEAGARLGGHIRTTPFAGHPAIDEAADAFLARVPHGTALARAVGLGEALTSPAATGAAVWHGRLHAIPDGIVLGVPGDLGKLAVSPLLTWRGKARAALDLVLPGGDDDDSIGRLVRHRFGDEVHDRLVDALVGSIYAADTDRFSLAMVPQLAGLADANRSLLLGARRARRSSAEAPGGPVFYAPVAGMGGLVDATAAAARAAGATILTSAPVGKVERDGSGWRVDDAAADAVIVATPATAATHLLPADEPLTALLRGVQTAGVAVVTLAVGADSWPAELAGRSGYLVPKSVQRRVTAVSFGSQKWRHWDDGRRVVLRVSIGRDGAPFDDLDDDALVRTAVDEVRGHLGIDLQPTDSRVSRWPAAFPQYRPAHRRWLDEVEAASPAGLLLAGASYRGIGIPACIAQGQEAARLATRLVAGARQ